MEIVLISHCTCKLQVVSRAVLFAAHISQCSDEAASWNTEESEFDSQQEREMFLLYAVQTGSVAHNAVSAVRSSPGSNTTWSVNLTTYLRLTQRSGMPGALYPPPPKDVLAA